jgi:hypothetical protein
MQAPQPPSRHMNLVPNKFAWFRINVVSDVSSGTEDGLTVNVRIYHFSHLISYNFCNKNLNFTFIKLAVYG